MRKGKVITLLLVLCIGVFLTFARCSDDNNRMYHYICKKTGISLPKDVEIEYTDSHGGMSDGNLFATVTTSNEQSKAQMKIDISHSGWRSMLPDDMYVTFFGGKVNEDGRLYPTDGYLHDFGFDIPNVTNGYFLYRNRYYEQTGEQCSYNTYAQNFTLAVFDLDTNTLYFIEGDS